MSKRDFPEGLTNAPEVINKEPDSLTKEPLKSNLPHDEVIFLGRRSEFNNSLIVKMKTYLDSPLYEELKDDDGKVTKRVPTEMPSIVGLAIEIGVHRKTVHAWINKYEDFANYIELLKQKQKRWLLYHGLNKNIDGNFGKFVAINCTDMTDKKEHSITTEKIQINIDSDDAEL